MDEWMDGWMDDTNGPMQNPSINRSTWRSPRRRVPKDRTGLCSQSRSTKSSSFVRVLDRLLTFPLHLSPSGQLAPNATCMICVCACACEQVSVVSSSIAPSVGTPAGQSFEHTRGSSTTRGFKRAIGQSTDSRPLTHTPQPHASVCTWAKVATRRARRPEYFMVGVGFVCTHTCMGMRGCVGVGVDRRVRGTTKRRATRRWLTDDGSIA